MEEKKCLSRRSATAKDMNANERNNAGGQLVSRLSPVRVRRIGFGIWSNILNPSLPFVLAIAKKDPTRNNG